MDGFRLALYTPGMVKVAQWEQAGSYPVGWVSLPLDQALIPGAGTWFYRVEMLRNGQPIGKAGLGTLVSLR